MRFTSWKRKILVIIVMFFLVGSGVISSTVGNIEKKVGVSGRNSGGYIKRLFNFSYSIFQILTRHKC